jgi:hypothetical protein
MQIHRMVQQQTPVDHPLDQPQRLQHGSTIQSQQLASGEARAPCMHAGLCQLLLIMLWFCFAGTAATAAATQVHGGRRELGRGCHVAYAMVE